MYQRNIATMIEAALADTPVVLLNGARQTGKTTLVTSLARERKAEYLSLDDATVMSAAASDPEGFIQARKGMVVIDEVQKVEQLFPAIKRAVDQSREPGRFLLTGSANVLLLPSLSESLAGRMEILTLFPLSQGEIAGRKESFVDRVFSKGEVGHVDTKASLEELVSRMVIGGYPEVRTRNNPRRRDAWFGSYITTILQRDIRDLANIDGLADLPRLLATMAARTGSLLNMSELSRSSGIPNTSLKRYLSLLQATYMVHLLPAWTRNISKRLLKSPKLYGVDSGLVCHLIGRSTEALLEDRSLMGHVLENFVIQELQKQMTWSDADLSMYHCRTTTGYEVDAVLESRRGDLVGIEIKGSWQVTSSDIKGLRWLARECGRSFKKGIVLYAGKNAYALEPGIEVVPVQALWA